MFYRHSVIGTARRALVCIALLLVSSACFAQATRTWVSGVGDDANPCSRTAPCKTFAGAISKTAAGGEIDVLDPGGFGTVTITKAITIDGSSMGGILASGTNGIIVNAGANDVVRIRNMNINGSGTGLAGIRFLAGKTLHVDQSVIYGFSGFGIDFLPSAVSRLFVNNVKVNGAQGTGGGIQVAPTGTGGAIGTIDNTRLEGNTHGLIVRNGSIVTIRNSVVTGNLGHGVTAISTTDIADLTVENSFLSSNGGGAGTGAGVWSSGPMAVIHISNNVISDNEVGLGIVSGGQILSFGNNKVADNTTDGNPTGSLTQR
jgi:hypothetical protein